jgi:hypothetical protein
MRSSSTGFGEAVDVMRMERAVSPTLFITGALCTYTHGDSMEIRSQRKDVEVGCEVSQDSGIS